MLLVTLLYFGDVMGLWKKNNAYVNRRVKNGVRKLMDLTKKRVSYKNAYSNSLESMNITEV